MEKTNTLSVWPSFVPCSWTVPTNERFNAANWDWFDCLWAVKEENYRHYVEQLWQLGSFSTESLCSWKKSADFFLFFSERKKLLTAPASCITLFCVSLWWILLPAGELLPHVHTPEVKSSHNSSWMIYSGKLTCTSQSGGSMIWWCISVCRPFEKAWYGSRYQISRAGTKNLSDTFICSENRFHWAPVPL